MKETWYYLLISYYKFNLPANFLEIYCIYIETSSKLVKKILRSVLRSISLNLLKVDLNVSEDDLEQFIGFFGSLC